MSQPTWVPEFEAYARDIAARNQIPGMAVAVAQNGDIIYEGAFGYRDVEQQLPVTPDTVFRIASVTKTFTALAIMLLEDAGKLSVHDPIVKWLPEFKLSGPKYQQESTIHHVLTHTSGLPQFGVGMMAPDFRRALSSFGMRLPDTVSERAISTVEEMMEVMVEKEVELLAPPGQFFSYSNSGYALLQAIVERASGKPLLSHLREHIFEPLGMARTTSEAEAVAGLPNVSLLYTRAAGFQDWRRTEGDETEGDKEEVLALTLPVSALWGGMGLASTVRDLVRYFEVYRNKGLVNGQRIVSPAAVQNMTAPQARLSVSAYGYGIGLQPDYHGVTVAGHAGGGNANVRLAVEKQTTVAVLSNLHGGGGARVGVGAINAVLGLPLDTPLNEVREHKLTPEQLARFVGTYKNPYSGRRDVRERGMRVYLQEGVPYVEWLGRRFAARPYAEDAVVGDDDQPVRFLLDDNRTVLAASAFGQLLRKVE